MNQSDKIYVAGHNGMVGSAIVRKLREKGFINIPCDQKDQAFLAVLTTNYKM